MPPLPKRKISTRRQGKRRQSKKAFLLNSSKCRFSGAKKLSHIACPNCGKY